jgi:plastocyanin
MKTIFLPLALAVLCATAQAGEISGKVTARKGIAVVYVDAIPGKTFPAPAKAVQMDQKSLMFQPHILVTHVGATVDFLNNDKVQHNIFWPAINGNKKLGHNMGTWPTGEIRSFKFETPGIVPLLCNVHPEMSGYIIVSPTPYYAESDEAGNFKIANVPDGSYMVTAWHEGFKTQTKPVMVSGATKLDFALTK